MKSIIEIEIKKIKVDNMYYSFEYKIIIDGNVEKVGSYNNDHEWHNNPNEFKEHLKNGGAIRIALEQIF